MKYTHRPEYMQRLLDLMGTPDIKIITEVRLSGKSELMKKYAGSPRHNLMQISSLWISLI